MLSNCRSLKEIMKVRLTRNETNIKAKGLELLIHGGDTFVNVMLCAFDEWSPAVI